ncbi:MAG: hypothetical protein HZY78_14885 [Burkholderiaceae bacterium]|nr:MAG: hypothetical protein HZY78_14885 [Burkholderiaceae bacterium]
MPALEQQVQPVERQARMALAVGMGQHGHQLAAQKPQRLRVGRHGDAREQGRLGRGQGVVEQARHGAAQGVEVGFAGFLGAAARGGLQPAKEAGGQAGFSCAHAKYQRCEQPTIAASGLWGNSFVVTLQRGCGILSRPRGFRL